MSIRRIAWVIVVCGSVSGCPSSASTPQQTPAAGAKASASVSSKAESPDENPKQDDSSGTARVNALELGELVHVAGKGEHEIEGENHWSASFEGGPAIQAELSHPYFTVADPAGAIYIADKEGHAVRRVDVDGSISTWLGTSHEGNGPDAPTPARQVAVTLPNGLWLSGTGSLYVLDLGNGKIRRVDREGIASTLATIHGGIDTGRGLWVSDDERTVYFASKSELKRWTPQGVTVLADGFVSLGNLVVDRDGSLIFTDRGGNRVYRRKVDGEVVPLAGNGLESGGGSGKPALESALLGPRGVAVLGDKQYAIATHRGRRLWALDRQGVLTLVLDGATGDGTLHVEPGTIGVMRGLSRAPNGDLWLTHGDGGQVHVLRSLH